MTHQAQSLLPFNLCENQIIRKQFRASGNLSQQLFQIHSGPYRGSRAQNYRHPSAKGFGCVWGLE